MQRLYNFFFNQNSGKLPNYYYLSLLKEDDKWSIHGLWPQYSTNTYPTYCKPVKFDILKLDPIIEKLRDNWYSDQEKDELFWKHEWEKHGSCMFNNCDEFAYFSTALKLYFEAIEKNLPDKYYNKAKDNCLIPVNLQFKFI